MKLGVSKSLRAALGLIAAAAILSSAAPAAASEPEAGQGRRMGRMGHRGAVGAARFGLRQLDLTEAQQAQIRVLFQARRDEFQAVRERMRTARMQMREATTSDAVNETALRTAAGNLADAQADAALLGARLRQEVLDALTPEQREKAKSLRADFMQRFKERRGRSLKPRDQGQSH
jgi:protein CpxP